MRWPGKGSLRKDDKTFFYSGNRDGKFENRVGFVVSENISPYVKDFQAINKLIAKFMTRLSMHLRENKGNLLKKFCTEKFAEERVSNEFAHTTHREMLRLNNENNDENIEHIWKKIKTTVINSAKNCLGVRKNSKKKNWFNEKCKEIVDRSNKLREKALRNPTDENLERYNASKIETNKTLRKEKRQEEKRKIEEIEKNRFNSKKFFSNSKDVKQGYKQQTRMVRNQTGDLLTNEKDIAEEFKNYYKMLLNKTASRPSDATYIQYSTAEPSISNPLRIEINWSINKLKNNKAPGESNVVAELLKNSGETLKNEIWKMINLIWEKEIIPEEWNLSILCPVFKKGDILDIKNYREISLLDTCYKVLSTVLLERITPYAEEIIGRYQCGFRKGRSTADQIFILRQVMEKHYEFDKDLYMVFVDYKQAYDRINREELWNTLTYFDISKIYISMVKLCNKKTACKVKFLGESSSAFEVKSGLRQRDALSPTLFNLGLEKVIREINHSHQVEVVNKEIILAYADDIVILGNSRQDITQTMSNLVTASKRMGLCINEEKTKCMVLSRRRENQPNL
ncbi:Reverse transcriptase domain [Cinara cedri]|uniref:Reverse transcriptase domain n=1 Tax=Cinara cedri TaxID=506608 RepID=A0A5E4NDV8_9HEMI|nr:Reverse transcriptase domain [Cinara cedri]